MRYVMALIVGIVALTVLDATANWINIGRKDTQVEAVKAGVAHWVAAENGEARFEWITPAGATHAR